MNEPCNSLSDNEEEKSKGTNNGVMVNTQTEDDVLNHSRLYLARGDVTREHLKQTRRIYRGKLQKLQKSIAGYQIELARVRRIAYDIPLNISTLTLTPQGYISPDQLSLTESTLFSDEVPRFPGQVIIRDSLDAIKYALEIGQKEERRCPTFWTDASVSYKEDIIAATIAFKQRNGCFGIDDWAVESYSIHQRMSSTNAELVAIAQALQLAQTVSFPANISEKMVSVFSDSQTALSKIGTYGPENQWEKMPLVQQVVTHAKGLKSLGIEVKLHWVPGHKRVPGNLLADEAARRVREKPGSRRGYILPME